MTRLASLTVLFSALIASLLLGGCNTVHGMGQDIQRAGGAISGASK
ncbi:MAG: entericidin A/B family lipoprotein [Rubrivivax sp.]|nr:MAG: entericidin A/B family lipoprotein [Rubrivivax sp.]